MIIKEYSELWIILPWPDVASRLVTVDTDECPFVATAQCGTEHGWHRDTLNETTTWTFYIDGIEIGWEGLPDELRMKVRMRKVWKSRVRDYWVGLKYKDDAWYALEALEEL